jgi:hypothetical protein
MEEVGINMVNSMSNLMGIIWYNKVKEFSRLMIDSIKARL